MDSKEMPLLIPQTIFDAIRYKRAFKSFFTNTEFNQRFIGELYKVNVELLRYGVDYDYWSKGSSDSEDIKAFRIKDKDYVILHSGYISPYGNQKQSVLALDKVKDKIPNVKLVFTGFNLSDYAQELVNLVTPSLEKHIIFLPFLNRDTLRDLYARSDLILCLNKLRGGILTVYEAACLNKLILVSELHPDLDFILRHNLAIKAEDLSQYILKAYEGLITPNTPREWIKNELTWKRFEEGFYRILMPSCGTKVGGNNA
jgi:glycosyltransferase involved in cell wall biosynthesis